LDDEHGITMDAWATLYALLEESDEEHEDIVKAGGAEGRVWLPEGHSFS
jgi:hypothetical protein